MVPFIFIYYTLNFIHHCICLLIINRLDTIYKYVFFVRSLPLLIWYVVLKDPAPLIELPVTIKTKNYDVFNIFTIMINGKTCIVISKVYILGSFRQYRYSYPWIPTTGKVVVYPFWWIFLEGYSEPSLINLATSIH